MNTISEKINVDKNISLLSERKGRIKYDIDFIRTVLYSINEIGINKTSIKYNISKTTLKTWRYPNWNKNNLKKQYKLYPNKYKDYKIKRYKANKQKCIDINNKSARKRYHNDPSFRMSCLLRTRIWRVLNNQSAKKYKNFNDYIGCTTSKLKEHIEGLFIDDMTWDNYGKWHIDHIKPCCSFDLTDIKQQKQCFHYTNLQPLWAIDNLKKSSKIDI